MLISAHADISVLFIILLLVRNLLRRLLSAASVLLFQFFWIFLHYYIHMNVFTDGLIHCNLRQIRMLMLFSYQHMQFYGFSQMLLDNLLQFLFCLGIIRIITAERSLKLHKKKRFSRLPVIFGNGFQQSLFEHCRCLIHNHFPVGHNFLQIFRRCFLRFLLLYSLLPFR